MEELATYLAIWTYFIGGAYGAYERTHISASLIEMFVRTETVRQGIKVLANSITVVVAVWMGVWAFDYLAWSIRLEPRSLELRAPLYWVHASMLVGLVLMSLYFAIELFENMIAKIKASAARPQYDVVILSGFGANALADADLLAKPDLGKVPNIASVPDEYKTGAGGRGVGYFLWSDGLLYNTATFPTAPKSYSVLWDDANKGKIFLPQPKNLAAMELVVVATKLAGGDARTDPTPGFELLSQLKDRVLTLSMGGSQLADLYRSGSLNVGGPYSPLVVPKFIRDPAYNLSGTYDLEEGFFVDLQFMKFLQYEDRR